MGVLSMGVNGASSIDGATFETLQMWITAESVSNIDHVEQMWKHAKTIFEGMRNDLQRDFKAVAHTWQAPAADAFHAQQLRTQQALESFPGDTIANALNVLAGVVSTVQSQMKHLQAVWDQRMASVNQPSISPSNQQPAAVPRVQNPSKLYNVTIDGHTYVLAGTPANPVQNAVPQAQAQARAQIRQELTDQARNTMSSLVNAYRTAGDTIRPLIPLFIKHGPVNARVTQQPPAIVRPGGGSGGAGGSGGTGGTGGAGGTTGRAGLPPGAINLNGLKAGTGAAGTGTGSGSGSGSRSGSALPAGAILPGGASGALGGRGTNRGAGAVNNLRGLPAGSVNPAGASGGTATASNSGQNSSDTALPNGAIVQNGAAGGHPGGLDGPTGSPLPPGAILPANTAAMLAGANRSLGANSPNDTNPNNTPPSALTSRTQGLPPGSINPAGTVDPSSPASSAATTDQVAANSVNNSAVDTSSSSIDPAAASAGAAGGLGGFGSLGSAANAAVPPPMRNAAAGGEVDDPNALGAERGGANAKSGAGGLSPGLGGRRGESARQAKQAKPHGSSGRPGAPVTAGQTTADQPMVAGRSGSASVTTAQAPSIQTQPAAMLDGSTAPPAPQLGADRGTPTPAVETGASVVPEIGAATTAFGNTAALPDDPAPSARTVDLGGRRKKADDGNVVLGDEGKAAAGVAGRMDHTKHERPAGRLRRWRRAVRKQDPALSNEAVWTGDTPVRAPIVDTPVRSTDEQAQEPVLGAAEQTGTDRSGGAEGVVTG